MSAVIPKDLTGLVRHPTKMDAWIPGTRSEGDNLCNEIPIPTTEWGTTFCTLGLDESIIEFMTLTYVHQTQVHARFKDLYGAKKIIQSSFSGTTPDQLMDQQAVIDHARRIYDSCDPSDEEAFTKMDNTLDAIRGATIASRTAHLDAFAFQQTLKEKGLMTATTQQIEAAVQMQDGGLKRDELPLVSASNTGKSQTSEELIKLTEGSGAESDNTKRKLRPLDFDGDSTKRHKRKKSKAKTRNHLSMKNPTTRYVMGRNILGMLGKVQQATQDALKKNLLKHVPAADLVEAATGQKLPDYQANLINGMQAKADPDAPVVVRMGEKTMHVDIDEADPDPDRTVAVIQEAHNTTTFEAELDAALDKYLDPSLFPESVDASVIPMIRAGVREVLLEEHRIPKDGDLEISPTTGAVSHVGKILKSAEAAMTVADAMADVKADQLGRGLLAAQVVYPCDEFGNPV